VAVLGPSWVAARLESSKAFAKDLMARHGIPAARSGSFDDPEKAVAFVEELGGRAVVKADGLAAGKGVVVADDRDTAADAIDACLVRDAFGAAGRVVVVEEVLEGPEVSAFALSDGRTVAPLTFGQDFKRVGDGDTGPNTGGMGAYSPVHIVDHGTAGAIWDMMRRTVSAMAAEGSPYQGVLYAGLMLTADGPKVLEFNCRFGDPETQALLPRLLTDPAELFLACATEGLERAAMRWSDRAAVTVVMASDGYPGHYPTGLPIEGLDDAAAIDGVTVFHAGTAFDPDGRVITAGGRVLDVTAIGATVREARERAYAAVDLIRFDRARYRRDVAARAAEEEHA
jgi:phosphoribosylamine---glycine ligase